jgi:hypothetical protein
MWLFASQYCIFEEIFKDLQGCEKRAALDICPDHYLVTLPLNNLLQFYDKKM